jgi:cytochrome c oxidase subunit I+III
MFAAGLGLTALLLTSIASFVVAVPSGLQVFAWIATFWQGRVRMDTPTLFLLGFHFIFVLGGLTGVMVAVIPFDWQAHDSYFIVAHLHYVLIGGMVFPVFAALYYWLPVFNGAALSERLGRWIFALLFGGFNIAFFPMHLTGLLGMPRRVYTYADALGWNGLNLLSTVGAFIFALGVLLLFIDMARAVRRPDRDHGNPWRAGTLEWLPPREYGVRSIPEVRGTEPLWDRPSLAQEVEQGRYWLPGTVFGGRETLLTDARSARPVQLLRLPTDGWPPLLAAAGTAAFFLLLTVEWVALAFACGLGAIAAMLAWIWQLDRTAPAPPGRGGHGHLPARAAGRQAIAFLVGRAHPVHGGLHGLRLLRLCLHPPVDGAGGLPSAGRGPAHALPGHGQRGAAGRQCPAAAALHALTSG